MSSPTFYVLRGPHAEPLVAKTHPGKILATSNHHFVTEIENAKITAASTSYGGGCALAAAVPVCLVLAFIIGWWMILVALVCAGLCWTTWSGSQSIDADNHGLASRLSAECVVADRRDLLTYLEDFTDDPKELLENAPADHVGAIVWWFSAYAGSKWLVDNMHENSTRMYEQKAELDRTITYVINARANDPLAPSADIVD